MADYGTGLAALFGLPDTDSTVSGDVNVAYALALKLTTPPGALAEVGETDHYDSIDITEELGGDWDDARTDALRARATVVLQGDPRVAVVDVQVSFNAGVLTVTVNGSGSNGPFSFVLRSDGVNLPQILVGGAQ